MYDFACMCICALLTRSAQRPERKILLNWRNGQLWPQFGCWKTNLGSLEEQQCSPHPKTGSLCAALADLKLRDLAASVSWAPGLKACATLPSWQLNGWVQLFMFNAQQRCSSLLTYKDRARKQLQSSQVAHQEIRVYMEMFRWFGSCHVTGQCVHVSTNFLRPKYNADKFHAVQENDWACTQSLSVVMFHMTLHLMPMAQSEVEVMREVIKRSFFILFFFWDIVVKASLELSM